MCTRGRGEWETNNTAVGGTLDKKNQFYPYVTCARHTGCAGHARPPRLATVLGDPTSGPAGETFPVGSEPDRTSRGPNRFRVPVFGPRPRQSERVRRRRRLSFRSCRTNAFPDPAIIFSTVRVRPDHTRRPSYPYIALRKRRLRVPTRFRFSTIRDHLTRPRR